jgi:hypothetical protein
MRGVLVMVCVAGACGSERCKEGTALLSFTLLDGAEAASSFDLTLTIAGTTASRNLARKTRRASGSIEIAFAHYPSGQPIVVGLAARAGNQILASSTLAITASPGCTTLSLTLDGHAVDLALDDLSSHGDGGPDGGGDGPTGDGPRGSDLDLPDLRCASTVEDCFNGIDDDCNGLVDCADPQCGGIGECVPDPGGALSGTLGSPCPTPFPSATPLFATMNPGSCAAGSCACSNGFNGTPSCSATLTITNNSCSTNAGTVFDGTNASGCLGFSALSASSYYDLVTAFNGTCNAPSGGSPSKVAPTWSVTSAFCAGGRVGGGCAGGQICVPAAPNHCVLEIGDQSACTVPGYPVQNATEFFTDFDDSTRACTCVCDANGSCGVGFGNGGCGSLTGASGCGSWPTYDHAQINTPGGALCAADASSSGATSTSGFERTVCCLH